MRLLTWNIQHGGGTRATGLLEALGKYDADAVILTEYRNNEIGRHLRDRLTRLGYRWQHAGDAPPKVNSVLLATRQPSSRHEAVVPPLELAHRFVAGSWEGINLLALYFPGNREKVPCFEWLLSLPMAVREGPALMIGDLNTGRHHLDETGATFVASEYLDQLAQQGWHDAWRHLHPAAREYSWFSRVGNGFRIDHVWCTGALLGRVWSAEYDHQVREESVSDHSALIVDVASDA